jgi:hypothetical protein
MLIFLYLIFYQYYFIKGFKFDTICIQIEKIEKLRKISIENNVNLRYINDSVCVSFDETTTV